MVILVMGVSGSGKTTMGKRLAGRLQWPFYDADDFHSEESVAKMRAGIPLTDADRGPWLDRLRGLSEKTLAGGGNAVIACSALRRTYRERLLPTGSANVLFVYLHISHDAALARVAGRQGHYMPASLVDSQFEALEEPAANERVLTVDATQPVEVSVEAVLRELKQLH